MNTISKTVVLIISGFLLSCPEQETTNNPTLCPSELDLGEITLIDSSLALFPYKESDSKVIFKDSPGNEINFVIENLSTREKLTSLPGKCIYNQSQNVTYVFKLIYRYVELVNDSIDLRFKITMTPELYPFYYSEIEGNDILILGFSNANNTSNNHEIFQLLVNRRNNNPGTGFLGIQPNYEDSISLNDVDFEKVYWGQQNDYHLYFTKENGIIGIKNQSNDLLLVFDRIE